MPAGGTDQTHSPDAIHFLPASPLVATTATYSPAAPFVLPLIGSLGPLYTLAPLPVPPPLPPQNQRTDPLPQQTVPPTVTHGTPGDTHYVVPGDTINEIPGGGNGDNTLVGGYGSDLLFMGGSSNRVVYSKLDVLNGNGGDTISGSIPGVDTITLEIPGLSPGTLASLVNDLSTNTFTGSATGTADPQVILSHWNGSSYDSSSHLWVDYDGSGSGQGYQVADLGSSTPIAAGDITVT